MLRKKTNRDPIASLELGGAMQLSHPIRIKRLSYKKVLKYVVLIVLGIALHSIYREMFQSPHIEEIKADQNHVSKQEPKINDPPDLQLPPEAQKNNGEPPGGRILDDDTESFQKKAEEKAKQFAEKVFNDFNNAHGANEDNNQESANHNRNGADANFGNDEKDGSDTNEDKEVDFGVEEDQGSFDSATNMKVDTVENQSNIKFEENLQKQIADIMEDTYDEIKLDQGNVVEKAPIEKVEDEFKSPDDPIDTDTPKEVPKIQEAVEKVENIQQNIVQFDKPHDHGLPNLVTAARKKDLKKVEQLIISVQRYFPNEWIYVYDIDLEPIQHKRLAAMCNVRMRSLLLPVFPKYVQDLDNFHWRPLVMHIAVTEFEHITWINPDKRLKNSAKLLSQVPKAHDTGVLVIGQTASYTTFAVTHPDMYKFIKTDRKKLSLTPHIDIYAVIMHNSEEMRANFMKLLLACTMNPACLAPPGASTNCDFDFSGRLYANCHQYDHSAVNILLKNWFNFEKTKYATGNCCFDEFDPNFRVRPKICYRDGHIENVEL